MIKIFDINELKFGDKIYIQGVKESGKHNLLGNILKHFHYKNIYIFTDKKDKNDKVEKIVENKKIHYIRKLDFEYDIENSIIINKFRLGRKNYKSIKTLINRYENSNIFFQISQDYNCSVKTDLFNYLMFLETDSDYQYEIFQNIFYTDFKNDREFNKYFDFFTNKYNCIVKSPKGVFYYVTDKYDSDTFVNTSFSDTDSVSSILTYYTDISKDEIKMIRNIRDREEQEELRAKYRQISQRRNHQLFEQRKINKELEDCYNIINKVRKRINEINKRLIKKNNIKPKKDKKSYCSTSSTSISNKFIESDSENEESSINKTNKTPFFLPQKIKKEINLKSETSESSISSDSEDEIIDLQKRKNNITNNKTTINNKIVSNKKPVKTCRNNKKKSVKTCRNNKKKSVKTSDETSSISSADSSISSCSTSEINMVEVKPDKNKKDLSEISEVFSNKIEDKIHENFQTVKFEIEIKIKPKN